MRVSLHSGDIKVNQLDPASNWVIEDVFRFDIPVTNSLIVHITQAVQKRLNDTGDGVFIQDLSPLMFLPQVGAEIRVVHVLDDHVAGHFFLVHEEIFPLYNGLMVQLLDDLIAVPEVVHQLEVLLLHNLDRVAFMSAKLPTFVDHRLGSLA